MERYRRLDVWKRAHVLCIEVLRALKGSRNPEAFALFGQIRRASVSIEANIVEGYALQTSAQFRRHLRIALGSAAELQCLIRIAAELQLLDDGTAGRLDKLADRAIAVLFGLLRTRSR